MAFHPIISDLRVKVLHILQWPCRRKKNTKDVFKKKYISTKHFFKKNFLLDKTALSGIHSQNTGKATHEVGCVCFLPKEILLQFDRKNHLN